MAGHETDSAAVLHSQNFLKHLKKIDDGLTSSDVQKLCFLCRDFEDDLAWKELAQYTRGIELFSALKKADLLAAYDLSLLLEMLEKIKRRDLLKKVKKFWPDAHVEHPRLSPYRTMLLEVADNTTKSELSDMKMLSELPYAIDDDTSTIEFFLNLENHGKISREDVSFLNVILENKLSQRKVQNYVEKYSQATTQPSHSPSHGYPAPLNSSTYTTSVPPVSSLNLKTPQYFSIPPGNHQPVSKGDGDRGIHAAGLEKKFKELTVSKEDEVGRDEAGHANEIQGNLPLKSKDDEAKRPDLLSPLSMLSREFNNQGSVVDSTNSIVSMTVQERDELTQTGGENLPVVSHNAVDENLPVVSNNPLDCTQSQTAETEEDRTISRSLGRCYKMSSKPPGFCLIINNEHFKPDEGVKTLKERAGSSKDVEKLLNCFHKFNFEIIKKDDLSTDQMFDELNKVRSSPALSTHNAFVCCILTHGRMGELAGSNCRYLKIQEIVSLFAAEKCKGLAGKPKMFFIQACQGREEQHVEDVEQDCARPAKESGIGVGLKETVPNQADFLLGFATVPGYVSYRSRTTGSWYIPALVDALNNNYLDEDLLSILTIVNEKLSAALANTKKGERGQVPAPVTTLRRKVFFHRKENVEYN